MNYAHNIDGAITKMLKFSISFSKVHNSFLFKNKWVNEYDETIFQEQIDEIKNLLHVQLKTGLNQKTYLQSLTDQIWKRIEWLDDNNANLPQFLELYSENIIENTAVFDGYISNHEKYQRFINSKKEISSAEFDLFNFLEFHSEKMDHYIDILNFEKGLLLYAIDLYLSALYDLFYYIDSIYISAEFTDFENYDFEHLETVPITKGNKQVCHFNLDKQSVAQLFRILFENDLIVFNEFDKNKNLYEMKKFVQDNFTFLNEKKERIPIKSFNREYSEMKSMEDKYLNKQIKINDMFLGIFNDWKNNLARIKSKNG